MNKHYIKLEGDKIIGKYISNIGALEDEHKEVSEAVYSGVLVDKKIVYKWMEDSIETEQDPDYLYVYKKEAISTAKSECRQNIEAGFEYLDEVFQCEEKDQNNYNTLKVMFEYLTEPVRITLKNGESKELTKEELNGLFIKALQHKSKYMNEFADKRSVILACETIEEIEALE